MTTTAWAHLPNAAHIDRVIASAKAHPDHWAAARNTAQLDRLEAWHAALRVVRSRNTEWDAAWEAREAVCSEWVARDAVLALIAYDDCAYMLDSDPSELAILAAFGDHRAILLLTACKVFHSLKELA